MSKKTIEIEEPSVARLVVSVIGTAPFLSDRIDPRFLESEHAKRELSPEELDALYESKKYYDEKMRAGIPAAAFKKAFEEAAKGQGWWVGGKINGKRLKGAVSLTGVVIPLESISDERKLEEVRREDIVNQGGRKSSKVLRRRVAFYNWRCKLPLDINVNLMSVDDVVKVINMAGVAVGVGNWRPQCSGTFGTFRVEEVKDAKD